MSQPAATPIQRRILVVEDDPDVRDYASWVLEDCGYAVLTAPDGATALSMLREGMRIDVLFTDIVMPGLDGIEVARRALEQVPGLKVLFMTGYAEKAAEKQHFLDAATDMISKPFTIDALANKIREMINA